MPIYENSNLYEEAKCSYREAIKNTEEEIADFFGHPANPHHKKRLNEVKKRLAKLDQYLLTLEEYSIDLPDDELITYQLL